MPPIPSTYDEETKSLIESIQRRQKDLSEFQIPRLRNCKGPLLIQQNLAAELREDMDTLGGLVEVSIAVAVLLRFPGDTLLGSGCISWGPEGSTESTRAEEHCRRVCRDYGKVCVPHT
jgi:hypothetical protein